MLWLANLLILIGMWTLGNRWRHAFLFSIAGEVVWAIVAASRSQWELSFICAVFCVVAARNWVRWGKDSP